MGADFAAKLAGSCAHLCTTRGDLRATVVGSWRHCGECGGRRRGAAPLLHGSRGTARVYGTTTRLRLQQCVALLRKQTWRLIPQQQLIWRTAWC